ncbi:hypothetical protein [Sphingomonas sp. R1]|uniref:hypothetical protein n=1 Tax=Sphingomonas sp. R1 TaxID=399176 RepID=UPI0022252F44|nr:hypothetical protein [Sphingomonas sp. R1]UYY76830.1 hypothetical protein OIM94_15165 [Sphingomonas sp. R1]
MNKATDQRPKAWLAPARIVGWGTIVLLIILPPVAMQFTSEVNWTLADFAFAIVMLGGVGLPFEMAVRANGSLAYRGGAAMALAAGLLLLWVNAAVGIVGNESDDINLWFDLVLLLALACAAGARFRPAGMAVAMLVAAVAQMAVATILQVQGHFTWVFSTVWSCAWLLSAWLFRKSALRG